MMAVQVVAVLPTTSSTGEMTYVYRFKIDGWPTGIITTEIRPDDIESAFSDLYVNQGRVPLEPCERRAVAE